MDCPPRRAARAPWRRPPHRDAAPTARDRSSTGSSCFEKRLDVRKLAHAVLGEFPADSGILGAAKGKLSHGDHDGVGEDHARIDAGNGGVDFTLILGPYRRSESPGCRVGQLNGGLEIV